MVLKTHVYINGTTIYMIREPHWDLVALFLKNHTFMELRYAHITCKIEWVRDTRFCYFVRSLWETPFSSLGFFIPCKPACNRRYIHSICCLNLKKIWERPDPSPHDLFHLLLQCLEMHLFWPIFFLHQLLVFALHACICILA